MNNAENPRLCPSCGEPMCYKGDTVIMCEGLEISHEHWECITTCPDQDGQRHRHFYPRGMVSPRAGVHASA